MGKRGGEEEGWERRKGDEKKRREAGEWGRRNEGNEREGTRGRVMAGKEVNCESQE